MATLDSRLPVTAVTRPSAGLRADLRAIRIVCHRELLRWGKDRRRLLAGLVQPLLWLFVLGTGLGRVVSVDDGAGAGTGGDVDFRTFLFPGVLATSVMFTAVFSGVSLVWDREFGFLREMLVAPIRRSSILAGKCLGGAIVATAQAVVILAMAGLAGVPYSPVLMVQLLGVLFLTSLAVTACGLLLGARVSNIQSVFPMIQAVVTPMMFLSGALYPTAGLPAWLTLATKANPVSYAVSTMRNVIYNRVDLSPAAAETLDPPLTWNGWPVPILLKLLILVALGLVAFAVAVRRFSKTD